MSNTYFITHKDDPKDRIEIEVGDSKQVDFYPQVKLLRWDNEANLSIRLITDLEGSVELEGKKIKHVKSNIESHFYEGDLAKHPEGSYEFDVILKERPLSNVLSFSIRSKGVEFFYQPELTQEEKGMGGSRPENVVGSYAVYYKNCPKNIEGGKEYKTGKLCHIYRPLITDSEGKTCYGDLNIDAENELLTITIDDGWLNKAIYPILVDPTIGYTSIGASDGYFYSNYTQFTNDPYAGADGTVDSISVAVKKYYATTGTVKLCLYTWTGNYTGGKVTNGETPTSAAISNTTYAWLDINYSTKPSVASGTNYQFAFMQVTESLDSAIPFDSAGSYNGFWKTGTTFPDPISVTSNWGAARRYSIYLTYSSGGGSGASITGVGTITGVNTITL